MSALFNSSGNRVINPVLTTIAREYKHPARVGQVLFPPVDVPERGGQVIRFNKESFRLTNARRAPGSNTKRVQVGVLADNFVLVQDALDGIVPREHLEETEKLPNVRLGTVAVRQVMDNITLGLEFEQAKLATDPTKYAVNSKLTLVGSDQWSSPTSRPDLDMDDAKDAVRLRTGAMPNKLVISRPIFNALKANPFIREQFKYTSSDSITVAMLANFFDLEEIAVGSASMLESVDDDAPFVDVWGNSAVLAYVPSKAESFGAPSFGYTYRLKGHPNVEQERWDGDIKSWIYGVIYERQPVMCGPDAGFLFQNVVGPRE